MSNVKRKPRVKISHMLKVKIIGLYKKVHVRCVAQKRVNSSPNTNEGEIYKSFYQEVNLQLLEYQGNLHLPGNSFCGPGTNLNKRLDEADNPKPWSKPINRVDEVCMRHNIMEITQRWKKNTKPIEKCCIICL